MPESTVRASLNMGKDNRVVCTAVDPLSLPISSDARTVDSGILPSLLLLRLALAGPAGYLKNALLRRRLGFHVADCARRKKKKQAWKEVALHLPRSAGPAGGRPYGSGTGGAPAATPLAANALYASRCQLRAWPGVGGGGALS